VGVSAGNDRKPLVLQTYLDAQEHLPYADDSNAVTPMSEENGAIIVPVYYANLGSRHSSYTSHQSRISYTSHGDLLGGMTKESRLRGRSRNNHGVINQQPTSASSYADTNHKGHREYVSRMRISVQGTCKTFFKLSFSRRHSSLCKKCLKTVRMKLAK
jgi:voltage-gated sodium channel type II alpha